MNKFFHSHDLRGHFLCLFHGPATPRGRLSRSSMARDNFETSSCGSSDDFRGDFYGVSIFYGDFYGLWWREKTHRKIPILGVLYIPSGKLT